MRHGPIRVLLIVLGLAVMIPTRLVGQVAAGGPEVQGLRTPNLVFIIADDLGYGDLGCYSQDRIRTPHIDRLATEGVRFTDCYAGSTVCAPSRCVLMTGLHTGHCRVRGNALVPLEPADITIAEVLRDAGYATALVGKWGLGEPGTTGIPNEQGFDVFFGYLNQHHAHNYYPEYLWSDRERVELEGNEVGEQDNVSIRTEVYSPDLMIREAERFLEANHDRPFFLYFASTLPHANNERGRAEGDGMEIPSDAPYSDEPWPQPQKAHAAMITRLDADVGRILAKLEDLGIADETIVFFTSDNGPHKEGGADPEFFDSNGPLRGYKRSLHDGGIRVPMIVRWPGQVPAGEVSDQVWAFWDVPPTLAELAGSEMPGPVDGVSIVPALLHPESPIDRPPLYWEFHERGFFQAARDGRWKAVRDGPDAPLRLFDLAEDIDESDDVSTHHLDVVDRLERFLDGARTDSPDFPVGDRGAARARPARSGTSGPAT